MAARKPGDLKGRTKILGEGLRRPGDKAAGRKNVLRAAAVLLSGDLTPEDRRAALSGWDRSVREAAAGYVPEVERLLSPDATPRKIDSVLSVDSPPIFVTPSHEGWPASHKWKDAATGLPVEVRRSEDRNVVVMIGNLPVDPLSSEASLLRFGEDEEPPTSSIVACSACGQRNRVESRQAVKSMCGACRAPLPMIVECWSCGRKNKFDPERIEDVPLCGECGESLEVELDEPGKTPRGGFTGAAGLIRVEGSKAQPQLYYVQSAKRQQGLGRRMLRSFCRLMSAYGFGSFAARGVSSEGREFLGALERENEIEILGWQGNTALIQCTGAREDPRRRRAFGTKPKPNPQPSVGALVWVNENGWRWLGRVTAADPARGLWQVSGPSRQLAEWFPTDAITVDASR